jgi:hypothetical protein
MAEALPPELLSQLLSTSSVRTIINARAASSILRGPASQLVVELRAPDGSLPPKSWHVFCSATRLRTGEGSPAAGYPANLLQLVPALPARLEELRILAGPAGCRSYEWGPEEGANLAAALAAAECSGALRLLWIRPGLRPAAADQLLQRLPSLRHLALQVMGGTWQAVDRWRPAAPAAAAQLTALELDCSGWVDLDLAGLLGATRLRKLSVSGCNSVKLRPPSAISELAALQQLGVRCSGNSTPELPVCCLQRLHQLRHLSMPDMRCRTQGWAALAGLPALRSVEMYSIDICAGAPPAAALASITRAPGLFCQLALLDGEGNDLLFEPERDNAGLLRDVLPQLERLHAAPQDWQALLRALQGARALRELRLSGALDRPSRPWAGQQLHALAGLQDLWLLAVGQDPKLLLADVALCRGLTKLRYEPVGELAARGDGRSAAALALLAAGPCSGSLQSIGMDAEDGPLPTAAVAQLLKGQMAVLRRLEVELPEIRSEVKGLLQANGATVEFDVSVSKCRMRPVGAGLVYVIEPVASGGVAAQPRDGVWFV